MTLDGRTLRTDAYTVSQGSTVVVVKASCLAALSAGEHTLAIVSQSGEARAVFTVSALPDPPAPETPVPEQPAEETTPESTVPGAVPQTGDAGRAGSRMAVMAGCCIALLSMRGA